MRRTETLLSLTLLTHVSPCLLVLVSHPYTTLCLQLVRSLALMIFLVYPLCHSGLTSVSVIPNMRLKKDRLLRLKKERTPA